MNHRTDTPTILIVDDHPGHLSVVVDLLEDRGCRVAIAQDGEAGLARAQLVQPSLILLDVMLPGADGFEICRRLKADEKTRDIPVIFMMALDSTGDKVKGFAAGGVDYLTKPLQIDETLARVDTHLKLYAAQRQLVKYSEELEQRVAKRTEQLEAMNQTLRESEQRYRLVFENSPVSLWEEDFSAVKAFFDDLKKSGVTDIEAYLTRHPETVRQCAERVKIVDVNLAALSLHEAASKEELLAGLVNTFTPESFAAFRQELIGLWNGETEKEMNAIVKTLAGELRDVTVRFSVCSGSAGSFSKVFVSLIDITERRLAEQQRWLMDFALNQVREAAYLVDTQSSRFIYVNDGACQALGYSREELLTMTVFDIDPDATPEGLAQLAKKEEDSGGSNIFERRHKAKDGHIFPVELFGRIFDYQGRRMSISLARDITRRKRMEAARRAHLRFFESLDWVNRAIQQANGLEQMMSDVLDVVRAIFDCDRAFLMYPCDPDAATWLASMESDRPEYPGVLANGLAIPMGPDIAATLRILLDADGPVQFGPGAQYPLPPEASEQFGFKSLMSKVLRPKVGKPWQFGIHQCSCARLWTADEERLFQEIGRRLSDGLTSLLAYRRLRETEAALRSVADSAPYSIIRYDRDCRMTYANAPLLGYFGIPLAELIGKRPCEAWPDGRYAIIDRGIDQVLKTETEVIVEFSETTAGGGIVNHQVWIVPERGASDEVVGIIAFGLNITERKQAEEQLMLAHFALNHTQEGAFLMDSQARFHYVNEAACRALGYEREALLSMDVFDIDPDMPRDVWPLLWNSTCEKGSNTVQSRHRTKDGRIFPIEVLATYFEYGGKSYNLAMTRDITERKQAEARLSLMDFALNQVREAVYVIRDKRFINVNAEACRALGYSREELLAMGVLDIDPDATPADMDRLAGKIYAEPSMVFERRHKTKDGRIFPVEISTTHFEYEGQPTSIALARDITERKETERKIAAAYAQVQELAACREEALENERKRIARDMHDELSQYLTAMRLGVSVLRIRFGADNPEMLAQVQNILALLDSTIQVVRSMVTRLRPAPLEMGAVSALEWLAEDFSNRTGVHCALDAGEEDFEMSDNQATAIFRIVQEALTNVARYAQASHVDICLEISGNDYLLRVRDDGAGFDLAAVRKKSFGLIGIRERAAILGGEATVFSAPGQGATIEVRIPIRESS